MAQFDRLFGILLVLQRTHSISVTQLAQQFGVSTRTMYRDLQTLSGLGVPLYSTRGHGGGIRLLEGFFLPPLTFSQGEGIALLLGLTLLQRLQAFPFPAEVQTAIQKLLVAVPDTLRSTLARAEQVIGFEPFPGDIFHPEAEHVPHMEASIESDIVTTFLQGILDRAPVHLRYSSPYHSSEEREITVAPLGLFWDRNHWYLAGKKDEDNEAPRLWRADRVISMRKASSSIASSAGFDIQYLLDRAWLRTAMAQWQQTSPVTIRLTHAQAERLQRDWYYRHAHFEEIANRYVLMTLGENNQATIFELLRWLGPGAELLEPRLWRDQFKDELRHMLSLYDAPV